MEVRDELVRLYATYNPKRLKDVDSLLERFKGREHVIVNALREKYMRSGAAAAAAARVSSDFSANPSLLFTNVSSVLADDERGASRTASVSSLPGNVSGARPPAHGVPALTPLTTPPPLPPTRVDAVARCSLDASFASDSAVSASTIPLPPPASAAAQAAAATASPPLSSNVHVNCGAPSTSAARQAEMSDLIRQMTALDVGQLAVRVEELSSRLSSASGAAVSRVPRLQWRGKDNRASSSSPLTPPSAATDGPDNVAMVLQHTSVFVKFFANCARRYVELAQQERQYWATRLQEASHRPIRGEATGATLPTTSGVQQREPAGNGMASTGVRAWRDTQRDAQDEGGASRTPSPPLPAHPRADLPKLAPTATHEHDDGGPPPCASPSPPRPHGCRSSSCVRNIRHIGGASPLSTDGAGSPPACRTTTVSPLTSPDDGTPERRLLRRGVNSTPTPLTFSPPHPEKSNLRQVGHQTPPSPPLSSSSSSSSLSSSPQPPAPHQRAPQTSVLRHGGHHHLYDRSEAPTPPPPLPPPSQRTTGLLTVTDRAEHPIPTTITTTKAKRVLYWSPDAGKANCYSPLCSTVTSGDCIVLQPGVYYENFTFAHCGRIELTSAYPGAAVVLRPFSDLEPVVTVTGADAQVTLTGIVLVQGEVGGTDDGVGVETKAGGVGVEKYETHHHQHHHHKSNNSKTLTQLGKPAVPLLLVRDGAEVTATASHFYGGSGGGIVAAGHHTRVRLDLCLISLCDFAGVYLHGGASADVTQSKLKKSEVGLRVLQGSFFVSETTFEDNESDGLVIYEESLGVLERSNVLNNGGNGVFLSSRTELRVVASTIELNALYGVQRTRGSTLHVKSSFIRDNGLLPINEETD
jgi:hypothetical protein